MSTVNKSTLQVPEHKNRKSLVMTNVILCYIVPLVDDFSLNEEIGDLINLQFGLEDVLFHCMTHLAPSSWSSPLSLPARTPACCCSPPDTATVSRCTPMLVGRTAGFGCNKCQSIMVIRNERVMATRAALGQGLNQALQGLRQEFQ